MISLIEVIEGSGLGYGVYPMIAKRKLYPLLISRVSGIETSEATPRAQALALATWNGR